ncbi:hypothetical protein RSOLAG1IB_11302 [Rhizoctonia solani AG-1 IB]|uniref:Uncharacterized protein n=1 Tax=Thanatephorus cucumeris (strain AG1-IB / isolate 7/3/14) TaxID=1108050 RepID=A0A0B7F6M0_THACB|nr:hypothetical protein RSOLAG1IB_11302 [Rhizoctonia solani AG-1 IB]
MSDVPARDFSPSSELDAFNDQGFKPIDRDLPEEHQVTLTKWLQIWIRLDQAGQTRARDIFGLVGHYVDPATNRKLRAKIDFSESRPNDTDTVHQISDVDSAIGIMMKTLLLKDQAIVRYHMVLSASHTLTTDLHIPPVEVEMRDGWTTKIPLHKIPNTRLFELEPRGLLRMHFPHLLPSSSSGVHLTEDLMRQLYDVILYPAAIATLPEDIIRDWAPSYNDEKWRGQKKKDKSNNPNLEQQGGYTQQMGRDVHAQYMNPWMDKAREIIVEEPEVAWAAGFFWSFEMRGTKNRQESMHPPPEQALIDEDGSFDEYHPRVQAVERMLGLFDTSQFDHGCWYIDLGTRITISDNLEDPSACTLASTASHSHLLSHFLDIDWDVCDGYTQGQNPAFQRDEAAHLNDVSGGRMTNPLSLTDGHGVCYIQIYTTDKSPAYNLDLPHHVHRTSARAILNDYDREVKQHLDPLMRVYQNSSTKHGVALRIESRVEFYHYPYYQLYVPDDVVRRCVYREERPVWWGWRVACLASLKSVLGEMMARRALYNTKRLQEVGTLLLVLVYMINALVNRPDTGSNWDQVHDAACVQLLIDHKPVPIRPLGALFLPAIVFHSDKQPRASSQRTLPRDRVQYLLGNRDEMVNDMDVYYLMTKTSKKRLHEEDSRPQVNGATALVGPRIANKQRRVVIMSNEEANDAFAHLVPEPEPEEYSSAEEDPEEREEEAPLSRHLSELVNSYPIQMMAKAPNRSNNQGSWCTLSARERTTIPFDFFGTLDNLTHAFPIHFLFQPDYDKWQKTVQCLFPTAEEYGVNLGGQGLSTLSVRERFVEMQTGMSVAQQEAMVKGVREHVSRAWVWLPNIAGKGHLWPTGARGVLKSAQAVGNPPGGPWIIQNPLFEG